MTSEHDAHLVDAQLPGASPVDAEVVFGVLKAAFPDSPGYVCGREEAENRTAEGHTVRTGTVDVRTSGEVAPRPPLNHEVALDLSGSPHAVRQVRDALARVFEMRDEPRIPGDQEVEIRLHLARP